MPSQMATTFGSYATAPTQIVRPMIILPLATTERLVQIVLRIALEPSSASSCPASPTGVARVDRHWRRWSYPSSCLRASIALKRSKQWNSKDRLPDELAQHVSG